MTYSLTARVPNDTSLTFFPVTNIGICWKRRPEHCCVTCPNHTNYSTLYSFSTSRLGSMDFNEGGTLWLSTRYLFLTVFLIGQLHTLRTQIIPCILSKIPVTKAMHIKYTSINESKRPTLQWACFLHLTVRGIT